MGIYKRKQKIKKKRKKSRKRPGKRSRKGKVFRLKNTHQFYFQPLIIVSVICRFDQIEYMLKNEAKCLILICVFQFLPSFFLIVIVFLESYSLGRERAFFLFFLVPFLVESERVFFLFNFLVFFSKFPFQAIRSVWRNLEIHDAILHTLFYMCPKILAWKTYYTWYIINEMIRGHPV